jgi:RHS repeat-associated protein
VIDESGETHFAYDAFGNVTTRVHRELGIDYTHQFAHDAGDQLIGITGSDNRSISYTRGPEGRIRQLQAQLNGSVTDIITTIRYRADGMETRVEYANGIDEQQSYDHNGLRVASATGPNLPDPEAIDDYDDEEVPFLPLWGLTLLGGGLLYGGLRQDKRATGLKLLLSGLLLGSLAGVTDPVRAETLRYDLNRNLEQRQTEAGTHSYAYDNKERLESESGPQGSQSFGYDHNDNRLSDGTTSYTHAPNSNRQATRDGQNVQYDESGNLTDNGQGQTYEYNQAGRLKRVYDQGSLIATYTYNAFGQRTRKVTPDGTTLYHYDLDGKLLEETQADGTHLRTYLWREQIPTAVIESPGTPNNPSDQEILITLHTDHLNTPRSATDQNGTTVWQWASDAFGTTLAQEDPDGDVELVQINLRFLGQYFDQESGLHYNYFRTYDPETGRYLESDPIGLAGGLNTYLYSNTNPIRFIDPSGLDYIDVINILNDIKNRFPNMDVPSDVDYVPLNSRSPYGASGKYDRLDDQILLPPEQKCKKLSIEDFLSLYQTLYHETRHANQGPFEYRYDYFYELLTGKTGPSHSDIIQDTGALVIGQPGVPGTSIADKLEDIYNKTRGRDPNTYKCECN